MRASEHRMVKIMLVGGEGSLIVSEGYRKIVKGWAVQSKMDTCLPTSLHNVLLEIAQRKDNHYPPFMPSFRQICDLCGYTPGGTPWDEAYKGLRTEMRRRKIVEWAIEKRDDIRLDPQKLCDIVGDKSASFPVVTLGAEYLVDLYGAKLEGTPHSWASHSVTVIGCSVSSYLVFDTYGGHGGTHLLEIGKNTFEGYWMCGSPRKGVMWFEKKNLPLERFQGGDGDE